MSDDRRDPEDPLSSIARRRNGADGLVGHGDAPVLGESCEPLISRQDALSRYPAVSTPRALPRERFRSLALHDMLHRHPSAVANGA